MFRKNAIKLKAYKEKLKQLSKSPYFGFIGGCIFYYLLYRLFF